MRLRVDYAPLDWVLTSPQIVSWTTTSVPSIEDVDTTRMAMIQSTHNVAHASVKGRGRRNFPRVTGVGHAPVSPRHYSGGCDMHTYALIETPDTDMALEQALAPLNVMVGRAARSRWVLCLRRRTLGRNT
jgi:hypothetical protein